LARVAAVIDAPAAITAIKEGIRVNSSYGYGTYNL
jgi:hypothetical protein